MKHECLVCLMAVNGSALFLVFLIVLEFAALVFSQLSYMMMA